MAHSVTVLLIGLVCLHCCHCLPKKEGDVIILNDDNFDRETATGVWMVDIFAPWCVSWPGGAGLHLLAGNLTCGCTLLGARTVSSWNQYGKHSRQR